MSHHSPASKLADLKSSSMSRRQIVSSAGAAMVVAVLPAETVAYPGGLVDTPAPRDEGFFFIIPGKDSSDVNDPDADRVFFISSAWLPLFELTDYLGGPADVLISKHSPAAARVTWATEHGLKAGDKIKFKKTSGLTPTGLSPGETYMVLNKISNYVIELANKDGVAQDITNPGTGLVSRISRKKGVVGKLNGVKDQKWTVLYSDDVAAAMPVGAAPGHFTPLPDPPNANDTYLAMSII